MSTLEKVSLKLRTITTKCGEFAVIAEQAFDGKTFLALLPTSDVMAFLEDDDYAGFGPELVEVRDGAVQPITEADQERFLEKTREQVKQANDQGAGR